MSASRPYENALITGASSGIGRALALELGLRGVPVVLAARRREPLEELARMISQHGGKAHVRTMDVSDTETTVAALREVDDELGGLDLVIANAGVGATRGNHAAYAWETMRDALHTNFCGAAATLTAVLPRMVARGRGHLVGIGSLASYGALPASSSYCAPKAGLSMLLDCLRLDLAGTGVAVTHVELGFVETPMVRESTHPMPQIRTPEVIARLLADSLPSAPRRIVHPRMLAAATRVLALLPEPVREAIARRSR